MERRDPDKPKLTREEFMAMLPADPAFIVHGGKEEAFIIELHLEGQGGRRPAGRPGTWRALRAGERRVRKAGARLRITAHLRNAGLPE